MTPWIEVLEPGPLSTVQDLGRPGHSSSGVPESGALDATSLRLATRLVGNDEDRAGIEVPFGGLHLRAHGAAVIAVTGALVDLRTDSRASSTHSALYLNDGATLRLGTPTSGTRSYVAVRGGLQGTPIYGSLSTDLLSGLGAPLAVGQRLDVGRPPSPPPPVVDVVPFSVHDADQPVVVRAMLGPRDQWFTDEALNRLNSAAWSVDVRSNRVGLRLTGPTLARSVHTELPSEGVVRGAIQVPSNGQPIVFLNDHPVTGGYPVIAVVEEDDLETLSQVRPGQRVRIVARPSPFRRPAPDERSSKNHVHH